MSRASRFVDTYEGYMAQTTRMYTKISQEDQLQEFAKAWRMNSSVISKDLKLMILEKYMPKPEWVLNTSNKNHVMFINAAKELDQKIPNVIVDDVKINKTNPDEIKFNDIIVYGVRDKWIILPAYFKMIGPLRKGEQHALTARLLDVIKGDWRSTMMHNSVGNIIKFNKILKLLNLNEHIEMDRDVKFGNEAQMHAVRTMMRIPTTLDNIQNATDSMCAGIEHMGLSLDGFMQNFDQFNGLVTKVLDKFSGYCEITQSIMVFAKLVAFGYLLADPHIRDIKHVVALLTLILPVDVIGKLKDTFLLGLLRAVEGIRGQFQGNVAQIDDNNSSLIGSFFELTKMIFINIAQPIDLEVYKSMSIKNNKIKLISDYLKSTSTIYEYFSGMFMKIIEVIADMVIKYYGYLPAFLRGNEVNEIIEKYQGMCLDGTFEKCMTSSEEAKKVIEFHSELVKLEAKTYQAINSNTSQLASLKILPYLRLMVIHLSKVLGDVPPHVREGFEGFRRKPWWLYWHGPSGYAKSSLLQRIIASLLAKRLKLVENFDDPANYSYYRNMGAKFYAKYFKQPIWQYNDMCQNYMDDEAMNEAIVELTNIVDEAPYELNMPDVESKGKVYCVSKIVISNAQHDIIGLSAITSRCWSGGVHIYRRRNLVVEPIVPLRYRKDVGPGIDWDKVKAALDNGVVRSTFIDIIPHDLYKFKFTHPVTGFQIQLLDCDAGIEYILNDAEKYFKAQEGFQHELMDCMRRQWNTAQMFNPECEDAVFEDATCTCIHDWYATLSMHPMVVQNVRFQRFLLDNLKEKHDQFCMSRCRLYSDCDEEYVNVILVEMLYEYYLKTNDKWNFRKVNTWLVDKLNGGISAMVSAARAIPGLKYILGIVSAVAAVAVGLRYYNRIQSVAESDEGSRKAKKVRIRRKHKVQGVATGAAQYDDTNKVVENTIRGNFAVFFVCIKQVGAETSQDVNLYMNALCIGGSVFILPRHYWYVIKQASELAKRNGVLCELYLKWSSGGQTLIPWTNIDIYEPDQDYLVDVMFIRVRRLTARRDIRHFWVKESDDIEFHEAYLYGLRSRHANNQDVTIITVDGVQLMGGQYKVNPIKVGEIGETKEQLIVSPVVYEYYNCKTLSGDCGAVLMFVNDRLNGRVISGIHVGGNKMINSGFSAPVFQEDLDEAFEFFKKVDPIIRHDQKFEFSVAEMDVGSKLYAPLKEIGANIVGSTGIAYGKRIKVVLPRKTKLSQSLVFDDMIDDFGPNRTNPAALRPFSNLKENGELEVISPLIKAYKKVQKYAPQMVPLPIYDMISQHMTNNILKWKSVYTTDNAPRKVLTDAEAINGIYGLKQLDLSTSPGFPYVFNNKGKGKRNWFIVDRIEESGFTHYKMDDRLQRYVDVRLEKARDGIIYETYFIDTLKDEPRPCEKVKLGKTRLFQIGPMDLTIAVRKYFGAFLAHLTLSYNDGAHGIGMNCNSAQWHDLVKFMSFYQDHDAGDFSDYDYSTSFQTGMNFADQANQFYDDGDENKIIRMTLIATCINSYHIVDTNIIYSDQGMNSGVAVTAHMNGNSNMFNTRLGYLSLCEPTLNEFNAKVKEKYYGDDQWLNTHPEIRDKFNMFTLEKFYQKWGYVYTTPDKSDLTKPWFNLDEVSFLKRKTVFRKDLGIYVGQLSKDIIEEIPRWSESDPNNMRDQMNRFNSALNEAANYDIGYFEHLRLIYTRYCRRLCSDHHNIDANDLFNYFDVIDRNYGDRAMIAKFLRNSCQLGLHCEY